MEKFMEIMSLMNYGLKNESTLKDVIPKIVGFGLVKNPSVMPDVMTMMPDWRKELTGVITACQQIVTEPQIEKSRVL